MSIDVFGHVLVENKEIIKGPPGIGFQLNKEGNFDIQDKTLTYVADAVDSKDAINLKTLRELLKDITNKVENLERKIRHLESQQQLLFADYNSDPVDTLEVSSILSNRTHFKATDE